jgi:DeoR/GlpR family transcriptional regulator of sugar metabolism
MEATKELFPEERRMQIAPQANRQGRVAVADLSQWFGVSEVTKRDQIWTEIAQAIEKRALVC